jgi:hypothetical protein
MMMTLLIAAAVIVVVGAIIFILMGRTEKAPVAVGGSVEFEEGVVSEPVPITATSVRAALDGVRSDANDRMASVPPKPVASPADAVADPGTERLADRDSGRRIRWTQQFEPRSGSLDDEARLRLINDLGMLRAPWCVPLLVQACEEETEPAHRVAAQLALARCREENAV